MTGITAMVWRHDRMSVNQASGQPGEYSCMGCGLPRVEWRTMVDGLLPGPGAALMIPARASCVWRCARSLAPHPLTVPAGLPACVQVDCGWKVGGCGGGPA
jgi:hypothetical protein